MKVENLPTAVQAHLAGFKSDGEKSTDSIVCRRVPVHSPTQTEFVPQSTRYACGTTRIRSSGRENGNVLAPGKLNVPRVVCFHEKGDTQYLLMTQISGVSGIHQDAKSDIPRLVRMFARGLREIHAISVDSCPLDWRMERYFAWATDLIDSGVLDNQIPDGETRNVLRDELDSIRADLPPEDLVFTHGDYCLPNVMIHDGRLSGYIDLGYAGVGDRYLDFVAVHYTIRRNLGDEWMPLFFQEYGHELDQAKLSVYQRIHDFVD